jgi:hypothetical protein
MFFENLKCQALMDEQNKHNPCLNSNLMKNFNQIILQIYSIL